MPISLTSFEALQNAVRDSGDRYFAIYVTIPCGKLRRHLVSAMVVDSGLGLIHCLVKFFTQRLLVYIQRETRSFI